MSDMTFVERAILATRWDREEQRWLSGCLIADRGVQYTDAFGRLNERGLAERERLEANK